ncbi:gamma-butyrobetaine hydroxylase-like domain-containing protein [Methylobrevis albus]|uniref:DUF971 domain-containing protein n=1 Tax=Methylobrevis albus TaxID=2793297 RepID=A0A931MWH9_9HYPH|nr:DUF971 domain-containing protein [Methylobrevis albus]MBH0237038.1 DUF971 domain-containing protein [Methylobrevis albus]
MAESPHESIHWPTEIRLGKDKRTLSVTFDDGARFDLAAEYLRVCSPSAEVQGHGPDQKQTVPGKRDVTIIALEPIGTYAVRVRFDDMHDTGLFTWDYLHKLGTDRERLWHAYLEELATKGLSRDPKKRG